MTETSVRVSPGGIVIHFGSLDSLAKLKLDSTHPVIAQEETHNATISRYLPVHRKLLTLLLTPLQLPYSGYLQSPSALHMFTGSRKRWVMGA